MSLAELRARIGAYRRRTGHTQQQLAQELGLHPNVLSHKLHGKGRFILTHEEVKRIVKILAAWEALTTQREALELLGLMKMPPTSFTAEEWHRPPLNRLEPAPPTAPAARRAENELLPLPSPATSLIGREEEGKLVRGLLLEEARLVTLTGPGGIGKTRLALQVAADLRPVFGDRVAFVSLGALREASLVTTSIARALRIEEGSRSSLEERIARFLGERPMLLVFDTFEHLLPSATVVADLLASAADLKVVVTSRARLGLYGEYEFRVPALGLPGGQSSTATEILRNDAARLFVERARAVRPGFEVSAEAAHAVAAICERLDGIPLAIELAAVHTRAFLPQQLLEQLSNRLAVLTNGPRNVPERQQTLKKTLDWSYQLLTPGEQQLFACLAVFDGSFDAEAAVAAQTERSAAADVQERLAALVDQSLLEDAGSRAATPRFRMLDTIREYARDMLIERGAEAGVRRAHVDYFLVLADAARPELIGPRQVEWLDRLEADHDNLRGALGWALAQGESVIALRLAIALWRYWLVRGHLTEGQQWLTSALAAAASAEPALRATGLRSLGNLMYQQTDYEEARRLHEEALALYRELDDLTGVASALGNLGLVAEEQDDDARAARLYGEALALYRELGDTWPVALTLVNLGVTASRQGTMVRAHELLEEGLALFRQVGDLRGTALTLGHLGKAAREQGDYTHVRHWYSESLALGQQLGDKEVIALALEGLAAVAAEGAALDQAARLWGTAAALREAVGMPLTPTDLPLYEREIESACTRMGDGVWQSAWQAGWGASLETAISDALSTLA